MFKVCSHFVGKEDSKLVLGPPKRMYDSGGSWTAALGRLFLGKEIGFEIDITYPDKTVEKFYLEDIS